MKPSNAPLYKVILSYLGHNFSGFQCQPDKSSVQDEVERAFQIFFGQSIKTTGASRTDSGVHAEHQVISFRTSKVFDEFRWLRSLNALVHDDIGFHSIHQVDDQFHPILSSKAKLYRYRLWVGYCDHPPIKPYVWPVKQSIDVNLLEKNLNDFVGRHDFKSFCATDTSAKTTARTILEVKLIQQGSLIDIWILGEGFLKQMIRIIVGTLVDQSISKLTKGVPEVLLALDRRVAGKTAPGNALTLVKIYYDDVLTIEEALQKRHKFELGF